MNDSIDDPMHDLGAKIRKSAYKIIGRLMEQMEISSNTGSFGATKEEILLLRTCVQSFTDLRADERAEIKSIDLTAMSKDDLERLAKIVLKEGKETTFDIPSDIDISASDPETMPPTIGTLRR